MSSNLDLTSEIEWGTKYRKQLTATERILLPKTSPHIITLEKCRKRKTVKNKHPKSPKSHHCRQLCRFEPCPPRLLELSMPKKRQILDTWKLHENILAPEVLHRFDQMLKAPSKTILNPKDARYYFKRIDSNRRKTKSSKKRRLQRGRRRSHRRHKSTDGKCAHIQKCNVKSRIRSLVDGIVLYVKQVPLPALNCTRCMISEQIVKTLQSYHIIGDVIKRTTTNLNRKPVIEICDKIADWLNTITERIDIDQDLLMKFGPDAALVDVHSISEVSPPPIEEDEEEGSEYLSEYGEEGEEQEEGEENQQELDVDQVAGEEMPFEAEEWINLNEDDGEGGGKSISTAEQLSLVEEEQLGVGEDGSKIVDLGEETVPEDLLLEAEEVGVKKLLSEDEDIVDEEISDAETLASKKADEEFLAEFEGSIQQQQLTDKFDKQMLASLLEKESGYGIDLYGRPSLDLLDKLIQILSYSSPEFLQQEVNGKEWSNVKYIDILNKLIKLREGLLAQRMEPLSDLLEKIMTDWAVANQPEAVNNPMRKKIHETALILSQSMQQSSDPDGLLNSEMDSETWSGPIHGDYIAGHKPSTVFDHEPNTVCCLSLKIWAIWLFDITQNASKWSTWITDIVQQVRYYVCMIRGEVLDDNGKPKILSKDEWNTFCKSTEEKMVTWRQYSAYVKNLSNETIEHFHGKEIKCCPKCLKDMMIKNVVSAHDTYQALTEAINCAQYWQRCLDKIMQETTKLNLLDVCGKFTGDDYYSTSKLIESQESSIYSIVEIDEHSESNLFEIEELPIIKS